ncbi:MAG: CidA/LrgA family protein [Zoogloeaceae bacterium]|nr:CidA/LrgA family protein [Zoogloeaceae bacterium]
MISALALFLSLQLAGEVIRLALHLPVPGPVIGMVLLLAILILRGGPSVELRATSNGLLQHLSLLFVPAGTGVMLHMGRLGDEGVAILTALVISTLIGLAVAGLILHRLTRQANPDQTP